MDSNVYYGHILQFRCVEFLVEFEEGHGLDFPIYILITYRDILILLKRTIMLGMSLGGNYE